MPNIDRSMNVSQRLEIEDLAASVLLDRWFGKDFTMPDTRGRSMTEYKVSRLTPTLIKSWRIELHPGLISLLNTRLDRPMAEQIKGLMEAQGLPRNWRFAVKWFSAKHGAIFVLRQPEETIVQKNSWEAVAENSWEAVAEKHLVGSRVKANVVGFLQIGAIVEFESGFRALVHNSEVSWTEKKTKAKDILRLGDEIEVVVQLVDGEKRQIHASYRQALENPWVMFLDMFPIGTVTTGRVVVVHDYGMFVMLSNGCVGLLHQTQFLPGAAISLGDAVSVVVLAYEQEKQRITLGQSSGEIL